MTPEPDIGRYPIELYGEVYTGDRDLIEDREENSICPFREDEECHKTRKTGGTVTGTCTVGHRRRGETEFSPHCICPDRLETDEVLSEFESFFDDDGEFFCQEEVKLERRDGESKSIDYVAGIRDGDEILDFVGIEGQALDTASGTVWDRRQAFFREEDMETGRDYHINWAMSLTKTMMQQALNKGPAFEEWGTKLIFLVQDVSINYLRSNTDNSGLRSANEDDPIFFYSYSLEWNDGRDQYEWERDEELSANFDAIADMMGSSDFPNRDDFEDELV